MSFNISSCDCCKHRCGCHRELFECHNRKRNIVKESSNIIIINSKNVNVLVNENDFFRTVRRNKSY